MATKTDIVANQLIDLFAQYQPVSTAAQVAAASTDATLAEVQKMIDAQAERTRADLLDECKKLVDSAPVAAPREFVVKTGKKAKTIKGTAHKAFGLILNTLKSGRGVYLYGPAGTGKSHTAEQVAEALELPFYTTSCVSQEYQLLGFIDAQGRYQETTFYKAFKDGGVFLLDEMDISDPVALSTLNGALANGIMEFPCGMVKRHKDLYIIGTGNTIGRGATAEYVASQPMNLATLDRFLTFRVDYDEAVEKAITGNNADLIAFCHEYRRACAETGTSSLFSYRGLSAIAELEPIAELPEIIDAAILKGMDVDTLNALIEAIRLTDENPYLAALKKIAA